VTGEMFRERCPECAELGHTDCYEAGQRAGREDAAQREDDLLELAWGLIANADVRTLDERDDEWGSAARKWRDDYHAWLHDWVNRDQPVGSGVVQPVEERQPE
jgi:hypothetical protein